MLVLNRRVGESITIDGQIKIKILPELDRSRAGLVKPGVVRVGVDAPRHIRILRDELFSMQGYKGKSDCPHCDLA